VLVRQWEMAEIDAAGDNRDPVRLAAKLGSPQ
jgi:hypothetical protein